MVKKNKEYTREEKMSKMRVVQVCQYRAGRQGKDLTCEHNIYEGRRASIDFSGSQSRTNLELIPGCTLEGNWSKEPKGYSMYKRLRSVKKVSYSRRSFVRSVS